MRLTAVASLIALAFCALPPAMAYEGPEAFTPAQAGATYPGTGTPANAWKLVGSFDASAVQIAPQWILTARHVIGTPVGQVGSPFTNAYGAAIVDAIYTAPAATFPAGVDIALCHLAAPIPVPASELPLLLSDFVSGSSNLPGQMLAAGRGNWGPVRAHWFPANEDGQIAGVQAVYGDSGSGVFWYPSANARPILRQITGKGGAPIKDEEAQTGTNPASGAFDVRAWIRNTIAGYGPDAGAAPTWTTSTAVAPLAQRTPNAPVSGRVNKTSANSAWLEWTAPPVASGVPAPTSYLIRLSPGGLAYDTGNASSQTLDIGGLQANTTYTATVQAVNANGPSGRTPVVATPDQTGADRSKFVTNTPPAAFASLAYEAYTINSSGTLQGCVRFTPTFASTGVPATTFGISNYAAGNLPSLRIPASFIDYCSLTPGASATILAAPWNHLSPGPSQFITVTPPAAVSGVPMNLTAKGLTVANPEGATYHVRAQWNPPNPPQPAATLNGYQMTVTCVNANGYAVPQLSFGLAANVTSWTVANVPPGGTCNVILGAQWSRTIPYNTSVFPNIAIPN